MPNKETQGILTNIDSQVAGIIKGEQEGLMHACSLMIQPKDSSTTTRIVRGAQALADGLVAGTVFSLGITESNLPRFLLNLQTVLLKCTEIPPERISAEVKMYWGYTARTTRLSIDWGMDGYIYRVSPEEGQAIISCFGLLDGERTSRIQVDKIEKELGHPIIYHTKSWWNEITNLPERVNPLWY